MEELIFGLADTHLFFNDLEVLLERLSAARTDQTNMKRVSHTLRCRISQLLQQQQQQQQLISLSLYLDSPDEPLYSTFTLCHSVSAYLHRSQV